MPIPALLHIGTRKTATSSIQRFMSANRERLLQAGIFWSDDLSLNQYELAYAASGGAKFAIYDANEGLADPARRAAVIARGAAAPARAAAAAAGCRVAIFSAEDFSVLSASAIARLLGLLWPHFEVSAVLCSLRRQDEYLVSNITTELKSGERGSPAELFDRPRYHELYRLDYAAMLDDWAAACGADRLFVWLHEDAVRSPPGALGTFLARSGITADDDFVFPDRENASADTRVQLALAALNAWAGETGTAEAHVLRKRIATAIGGAPGRGYKPPRAQAAAVLARYAAANERVRCRYFPDRPAPLFGDDISDYAEEVAPVHLPLPAFFGLLAPHLANLHEKASAARGGKAPGRGRGTV